MFPRVPFVPVGRKYNVAVAHILNTHSAYEVNHVGNMFGFCSVTPSPPPLPPTHTPVSSKESGSFRSYSHSVRLFRPGSFPDSRGESFRPDLFISRKQVRY